jgi:hypothetical protein
VDEPGDAKDIAVEEEERVNREWEGEASQQRSKGSWVRHYVLECIMGEKEQAANLYCHEHHSHKLNSKGRVQGVVIGMLFIEQ